MGVNCSQSVPVYVTQRCGSSWVVVDRCGIVVGRCGSLWDRCGSLWIVVDRCGSLWVVPGFSNYVVSGLKAKEVVWCDSRKAVRVKLLPFCEPRISRTEFVVRVEGKSETFITFIRLCQAPCLVLKTRRPKVKRDSSTQFKRCLPTSVSLPDWIPLGRKIQKHVHDSVADKELAVDRQEGQ